MKKDEEKKIPKRKVLSVKSQKAKDKRFEKEFGKEWKTKGIPPEKMKSR